MLRFYILLLVLGCQVLISCADNETITGKVVKVADGDTITIVNSFNKHHKIRLYGIDCPEISQPFGKEAQNFTAKLTLKKRVKVEVLDTDRYGRTVGVVTVGNENVNQEIIKGGYAWLYRKYCTAPFCSFWSDLEKDAKLAEIGLWENPNRYPPWEFRSVPQKRVNP